MGDGGRRAFVGRVGEIHAGKILEQFGTKMRRGTIAGRTDGDRAGFGFGKGQYFGNIFAGNLLLARRILEIMPINITGVKSRSGW